LSIRYGGLAALLLMELALFFGMDLFLSGFPIYLTMLGAEEHLVGILFGTFGISALTFRPILARFGQKHGQKWILLTAGAVALTAPWLYLVSESFVWLLFVRAYHGLVPASFITAAKLLVIRQVGESRKGLGVGIFGMVGGLSLMFGPYLGVLLLSDYGNFVWIGTASLLGAAAVISWNWVFRHAREVETSPHAPAKFDLRAQPAPFVANMLLAMGFGSVMTFASTYGLRLGYANPGQFFTLLSIMTIVTRMGFGLVSDRLPRRSILVAGTSLMAAGLLFFAFPPTTGWFLWSAIPIGLGFFASIDSLFLYVTDSVEAQQRSVAAAYLVNSLDVGFTSASLFFGFIISFGSYSMLYTLTAALALAGTAVVLAAMPEPEKAALEAEVR